MRRPSVVLLSIITLVLFAGVAGCGGGGISSLQAPADILAATMDASENMTSAAGTFQADLLLHLDSSELSSEDLLMMGIFKNPVTASGTLTFSNKDQAFDIDVTLGSAGMTFNLGLRMLQESMWVHLFNQWYDMSPLIEEAMDGHAGPWEQQYNMEDAKELLTELGVDPVDWFKDLTVVGQENLAGIDVCHLAGAPDAAAMLGDAMLLMQNQEFMSMVDPTGSLLDSMGSDMPNAADIAELESMIPQVFKDLTLDLWIGKGDALVRQATAYANIVPPAEEDFDGLAGLELTATMSLDSVNKAVDISAPDPVLPYTALEGMFGGGSDSLLPFMQGLQSGGMLQ